MSHMQASLTIDDWVFLVKLFESCVDNLRKSGQNMRHVVGEKCAKGSNESHTFCTTTVKPIKTMHGISRLQHLDVPTQL